MRERKKFRVLLFLLRNSYEKNLILMSALFAGSMFMNDGFGIIMLASNKPAVPVVDYVAIGREMQNAFETANSVIEHYADNPMEDPVAVYTAIVNFNSTYEAGRNRQGVDRTTFDREFSHFPADLIKKFRDSVAAKAKKECEAEILKKAECDNMDQMMKDIQDSRLFYEKMLYGYEVVDEEEVAESVAEEKEETNLTLMDSADTEASTVLEVNTKDLLCNAIKEKITSVKTFTEFIKTTDEMIKQYAKGEVEKIIEDKIAAPAPAPAAINAALKGEVDDTLLGNAYIDAINDKTIKDERQKLLKELLKEKMVEKITSVKTFTEFVKTTDEMIKQYAKGKVEEIIDDKIKAPAVTAVNAALKKEVKDGLNAAMAECQTVYKNKKAELTAKEKQEISGSGKAMSSKELLQRRRALRER